MRGKREEDPCRLQFTIVRVERWSIIWSGHADHVKRPDLRLDAMWLGHLAGGTERLRWKFDGSGGSPEPPRGSSATLGSIEPSGRSAGTGNLWQLMAIRGEGARMIGALIARKSLAGAFDALNRHDLRKFMSSWRNDGVSVYPVKSQQAGHSRA